jgi:membrane-associated phospholipid phosphatase
MASKKKKLKPPKAAERASRIEQFDAAVADAAARHRKHPAIRIAAGAAEIADQPPLLTACAATLATGAVLRDRRLVAAGARMLASELVATGIKSVVKRYVARTRPHKMLEEGRYALHHDKKAAKNEGPWNSFPSGHTAGAVAVARALTREYPGAAAPAAGAATAVALIQVPAGKHFPTDVAAGAAVGLIAEKIVDLAARGGSALLARRR